MKKATYNFQKIMPDSYPDAINNFDPNLSDDDSSSEDDDPKFGFFGTGGSSSASLSKYMAKREREAKRDLKKEIAKREMELKRENSVKDTASSTKEPELIRTAVANAPSPNAVRRSTTNMATQATAVAKADSGPLRSSVSSRHENQDQSGSRISLAGRPEQVMRSSGSLANVSNSRSNIYEGGHVQDSRLAYQEVGASDMSFNSQERPMSRAASGEMGYPSNPPPDRMAFENLQREFLSTEPELPDSVPTSKIMRRIGAYRNWTENEIQTDINTLESNRLRCVKDLRDLSPEGWKEIGGLLPLVKDLLLKEIHRGRGGPPPGRGYETLTKTAMAPFDVPRGFEQSFQDMRMTKAPVSTPMDTPDFNSSRRQFHPRNAAW